MTRLAMFAAAAALVIGAPSMALADPGNGNGHGKGHGGGPAQHGGKGPKDKGPKEKGGGPPDRGPPGHARGADRHDRGPERVARDQRGPDRDDLRRFADRDDGRVIRTRVRERDVIPGCPPGLAKKNNGCLPPGQAKRDAWTSPEWNRYDRYDYLWRARYGEQPYRYRDGYLYRLSSGGAPLGYLPVLGGALWAGNAWPAQYAYEPAPDYYVRYYRLEGRYSYRYADGVLYGLDPQTQAITQVAALLTGQDWTVGQRMPVGYDVYNVPYDYRDRYRDGPDRWYRYSDGYVYQVDPTTMLVQAAIQLLT